MMATVVHQRSHAFLLQQHEEMSGHEVHEITNECEPKGL